MATHGCEVELVPRDDFGRSPSREDTETKAAQQRRRTDVDPHHAKLAIPPHELDVRDSSQPPTAKVEDLAVEDIAREQESSPASSSSIGSPVITTSSANDATADNGTRQ